MEKDPLTKLPSLKSDDSIAATADTTPDDRSDLNNIIINNSSNNALKVDDSNVPPAARISVPPPTASASAAERATTTKRKRGKDDFLAMLLPEVKVKKCDPGKGLKLGDRDITIEELKVLSPDELGEHLLTRDGVELTTEEMLDLLGMPQEYAGMLDAMVDGEMGLQGTDGPSNPNGGEAGDAEGDTSFLPPNADELLFLAFSNQFG